MFKISDNCVVIFTVDLSNMIIEQFLYLYTSYLFGTNIIISMSILCLSYHQVVLKIIKHCHEEGAGGRELVQGVLLGLVDKNRLEVTNCFPFPRHTEDEDFDEGDI